MASRIQKWGNSLAVRIPKPYAEEVGLHSESQVRFAVREGALVLYPVTEARADLATLLAGVDGSNLHQEADWGEKEGAEAW